MLMTKFLHEPGQNPLQILHSPFLGEKILLIAIDEQNHDINHGRIDDSEV